ncbi:MAG: potassium channel family protein [Planctomycetes bacterium]|nr:potassium channel family protein [Planctomycetota bacterium]
MPVEGPPEDLQARVDWYLNEPASIPGRIAEVVIGFLILTVVAAYALSTVEQMPRVIHDACVTLELVITIVFLVEYLVRWWAKRFSIRYLFTPMAIIDFLAIVPLFLPNLAAAKAVKALRLLRVLRLLRLTESRHFFFGKVRKDHLIVLRIMTTVFCVVFITGGLIFELEREAQPLKFKSMFDGLYFAVVTLTTVGYGDLTPKTSLGQLVTMIMILTGVVIFPWQLTNLARALLEDRNLVEVTCTHCGLKRHDKDASHCKACGFLIYQEFEG